MHLLSICNVSEYIYSLCSKCLRVGETDKKPDTVHRGAQVTERHDATSELLLADRQTWE